MAELNRVDTATARLLTAGPNGRPVPENFEQLKPFCTETKQLTTKLESFIGRCYSKEIGRFARIALYSVKKSVNTFCSAGGRRSKRLQQFLTKANPCINKHLRHNDSCIVRFIEDMQATFGVEDRLKIPYLCCHTLASLQCLETELDRHQCGRQHHELIMEFVRTNTDDFFAIGCSEYADSSDRCRSLKPLPRMPSTVEEEEERASSTNSTSGKRKKKKQKSGGKKATTTRAYKTPVFIMIDLVSSIGSGNGTLGGGGFGR